MMENFSSFLKDERRRILVSDKLYIWVYLKGPVPHISLYGSILELSTNQPFSIWDSKQILDLSSSK
jgi:hypothetical protein